MAPIDWPLCFGQDPALTGCLWNISTRNMIAPDGLLPVPYGASPSPVPVTLIQSFFTEIFSECISISRNTSAFHPLTASKNGKVSLSLVSEWTLLNLPAVNTRPTNHHQQYQPQTTGRPGYSYHNDQNNHSHGRNYGGFQGPPRSDSNGNGPRDRLHRSMDHYNDDSQHRSPYSSGGRMGSQPARGNLRALGRTQLQQRGGVDPFTVQSQAQSSDLPPPPPCNSLHSII